MTTILTGDSREKLKELEDESIDALVTDPPYLINFMGKDWDKENSPAGDSSFWEEVLRVMKPGAHGLVFGHSRQHHRVMNALEDAGFEIRDCLMWLYGSGFPKSHNIGKAVDSFQKIGKSNPKSLKEVEQEHGGESYELRGKNNGIMGEDKVWNRKKYETQTGWEGWGTALKPAYEPIILVRKPLEKKLTVAKNVLKHGTGGLNIDASRIGYENDNKDPASNPLYRHQNKDKYRQVTDNGQKVGANVPFTNSLNPPNAQGRFPANVLLSHHPDCKVVGENTETIIGGNKGKSGFVNGYESGDFTKTESTYPVYECADDCAVKILDEQAPSSPRFFYCPKVGKKERNAGSTKNTHPTVKPIKLMTYLTKLITPPNGKVLDPFMGSGSTGMACAMEGFDFVGIDLDPDYVEISKARIEWARTQKK